MRLKQIYNNNNKRDSNTVEFVYRGMSNEEWEEAVDRGYILSDCRFAPYNGQVDGKSVNFDKKRIK